MGDEREGLRIRLHNERVAYGGHVLAGVTVDEVEALLSEVRDLNDRLQRTQDLLADAETEKIERGTRILKLEAALAETDMVLEL